MRWCWSSCPSPPRKRRASPSTSDDMSLPLNLARVLSCPLVVIAGCTVSNLDYSGLTCERAADCPAPYVCAMAHGAQSATCVPADQGVPTTDGGVCDVSNVSFNRDVQSFFTALCVTGCH